MKCLGELRTSDRVEQQRVEDVRVQQDGVDKYGSGGLC